MSCSPPSGLEEFAEALLDGLQAELFLTPKPGLVDLLDSGSHADLSLLKMARSIVLLRDYYRHLVIALQQQEPMSRLQQIGLHAENRMLLELGTNCHRGGIFLGGLLLSAYADCGSTDSRRLSRAVSLRARKFFHQSSSLSTHGQHARQRYQVGGVVREALLGFPGLFRIALPALSLWPDNLERGSYLAMARLMRHCEDTTCLHRGGQTGLARLRRAGKELEQCLLSNADPQALLNRLNSEFRLANLTMGGVADLLGLSFGYLNFTLQQGHQIEFSVSRRGSLTDSIIAGRSI